MAAFKFRRKAVLAEIEVTYGTDPTPEAATNGILLRDVTITPVDGTEVRRENIKPNLGQDPSVLAGANVKLTCAVELAGAGAAGTAPKYGPLLRACGLAETINAGTDVQYDPVSEGEESVTVYFHHAGSLHKMTGARGTWGLEAQTLNYPRLTFEFTGLYEVPAAAALPSPDFSAFTKPLTIGFDNTPTFDLFAQSLKMQSLNLAINNTVAFRDLVNGEEVIISNRAPSGSCVIETPAIGTIDFFAAAKDRTTGALQLVHGTVAGNIVQVDCPKVEVMTPSYSDSDDVSMLNLNLAPLPNAVGGDDEIKLTVK